MSDVIVMKSTEGQAQRLALEVHREHVLEAAIDANQRQHPACRSRIQGAVVHENGAVLSLRDSPSRQLTPSSTPIAGKDCSIAAGQLARALPLNASMSNASDRAKGIVEKIGGTIKRNIGKVIGNEQMEAEGKAKELEGNARIEAAKARERAKGKVETMVGVVKNEVGRLIDNQQMMAEGKVTELKGEARHKANQ